MIVDWIYLIGRVNTIVDLAVEISDFTSIGKTRSQSEKAELAS